jgi:hypothetical protein
LVLLSFIFGQKGGSPLNLDLLQTIVVPRQNWVIY